MSTRTFNTLVGREKDRNEILGHIGTTVMKIEANMRTNLEDQSSIQDVLDALETFRAEQQEANNNVQRGIGNLQETVSGVQKSFVRLELLSRVNIFVSILTLVFLILHDRKGRTLANIKHVAGLVSERLSLEPEDQKAAIAFCVKHNDLMNLNLTEEGTVQTQSKESPETSSESGKGLGKKG